MAVLPMAGKLISKPYATGRREIRSSRSSTSLLSSTPAASPPRIDAAAQYSVSHTITWAMCRFSSPRML